MPAVWMAIARRFALVVSAALLFGWLVSEASYQLNREQLRQQPQRIELVIPAGTSQRIAAGDKTSVLPQDLDLVAGDVLVVINQDEVSHQLGPIWVPAGATGTLSLQEPNLYSLSCSFQPQRYLSLNVRPRATTWIRFEGAAAIGLPSGVLLALYSLVLYPPGKKVREAMGG
ncbi:MAG: hypothetical protein GYA59_09375 [Chloroflexi bacterium]|nr:hypothetical protein [Chloroflexota bacterium]